MTKNQWRSKLKSNVQNLTALQKESYSKAICTNIISRYPDKGIALGIYAATQYEPDLSALHQHFSNLAYPRCGAQASMLFHAIAETHDLESGAYGIMEPPHAPATIIPDEALTTVLCPGWGFTMNGERLGKGGGYYDRYLASAHLETVGICFQCQVEDSLPTLSHDVKMSVLITEQGIFELNR